MLLTQPTRRRKRSKSGANCFHSATTLGLLAGEAEGEQKIADLENQLKRFEDALKDYAAAADLYRKLQNEPRLAQVEISQALLLIKVGRGEGKKAAPLEQEVALTRSARASEGRNLPHMG